MSWRMIRFGEKGHNSDAMEFEEAARMVEEGLECMRSLASEMEDKYSERRYDMRGGYGRRDDYGMRGGYSSRGGYGNRYAEREDWDENDMMNERRMRDSRGRFR